MIYLMVLTLPLDFHDSLLYGTICCDEDAADLQDDLYRLEAWQQKWKMEFSLSKGQIMCFTTKKDTPISITVASEKDDA